MFYPDAMINFLKRLFSKGGPEASPKISKPLVPDWVEPAIFPQNYSQEALATIKLIKKLQRDEDGDEEQEDLVFNFFMNSIVWINNHEPVNLNSFYDLIVTIRKYMPDWIEGNGLRIAEDLYHEGIQDKKFFISPENEEFTLKLVQLGQDGNHLACILLSEHREECSQSLIDQILEIVLGQKVLYVCDHIQQTPTHWPSSRDLEIGGSPLIELIVSHRLTAVQTSKIIKYLESSQTIDKWHRDSCNFYLALCPTTSLKYLTKLLLDETLTWGWIETEGVRDYIEITISSLAKNSLAGRKAPSL